MRVSVPSCLLKVGFVLWQFKRREDVEWESEEGWLEETERKRKWSFSRANESHLVMKCHHVEEGKPDKGIEGVPRRHKAAAAGVRKVWKQYVLADGWRSLPHPPPGFMV